ncbi:MAG: pyrimidine dimer DNA glycosylase/endonuclease V [Rhodanobacteraceae bacterium]
MRLWSLHPRYLDARGLVALWREGLLAQAVLRGQTRGYRNHPQLSRFRACAQPERSMAAYLAAVHAEADRRGYRFDFSKIDDAGEVMPIDVTRGQMRHEWDHLVGKLDRRSPEWRASLGNVTRLVPHPIFRVVKGGVAAWEIVARR